jgi:hypothetical protein
MGVDLAIVHGKESEEHYKDVQHPEKFAPYMKAVYDDGRGNVIYEAPRRYRSLARVVERAALDSLPQLAEDPPAEQLKQLVDVLEAGPDAPARTRWIGTDELRVDGLVGRSQALFVQVAYDANWHAYAGGNEIPVGRTQLGFMRVEPPEGTREIRLVFERPVQNLVGYVVFGLSVAALCAAVWRGGRLP